MTRYKRLVKESKKKFQYDGTQYEMNATSVKEYKFWDKELKKVYKKELKLISKKKAKKLKKLQKSWKEKRVKYSQKSAKKYNGGSMYVMVYNNAYTKYTKKRIKWLIKNYKDVGNF